jgi:hypothetical protein
VTTRTDTAGKENRNTIGSLSRASSSTEPDSAPRLDTLAGRDGGVEPGGIPVDMRRPTLGGEGGGGQPERQEGKLFHTLSSSDLGHPASPATRKENATRVSRSPEAVERNPYLVRVFNARAPNLSTAFFGPDSE